MKTYPKIDNVFKFDEKYRTIVGMNYTYIQLAYLQWIGTEKIDGTNIRVYWDGYRITVAGRTEKSDIPANLLEYLKNTFLTPEMEYVFEQMFGEKEVYLFGEGYGYKIQKDGEKYVTGEEVGFILFDVNIDGYDLERHNVDSIANKLGLKSVPVIFEGTLGAAITYMSEPRKSTLGDGSHEMEGLVLTPKIQIYDKNHKQFKCKCKYRDVVKYYETPRSVDGGVA